MRAILLSTMVIMASACAPKECDVADPRTCTNSQVCERVQGGKPQCFAPVLVQGHVFDLATNGGIAAAQVLATDENGAPVGVPVTSGDDGAYSLRVPTERSGDKGELVDTRI